MTRFPSGTVTLVFSDIERSTRLLQRLGEAYGPALEQHRALVRAATEATGGVEVETRGDSFLFVFASAHAAVDAAVAAQRALSAHEWPDGAAFRIRVGVHTGEPQLTDDGYVGIDVHRASRIGDAGHGGQILVSEATRALVGATVVLRELGEFQLGGLERPERLYQVVAPGLATDFPAPRTAAYEPPRRRSRPPRAVDVGWRCHACGNAGLAGAVLFAARLIDEATRVIALVDRQALAADVADHERRAGVAPHVATAAAELAEELAALDRLPERRRAVEEAIAELAARVDTLAADDLEDARATIAGLAQSLEQTIASAPAVPPVPLGKLRRTRRRGIYRTGDTFVVLERDEDGVKVPLPAATLAEAILVRESLRAARRHPHRELVEHSVWENAPL
jgi:class 3 adenylate cyclase